MSDADNERANRKPKMIQSPSMAGEAGNAKKVSSAGGLLAGYQPVSGAFDELIAADGQPRPHYSKLIGALEGLSPTELQLRWTRVNALSTNRGLPTMFMAIRAAWNDSGNWTRFLLSWLRRNGGGLKPDWSNVRSC